MGSSYRTDKRPLAQKLKGFDAQSAASQYALCDIRLALSQARANAQDIEQPLLAYLLDMAITEVELQLSSY